MSMEFQINEELASIAVTSTELYSASRNILGLVRSKDFIQGFTETVAEINQAFEVLHNSFAPFTQINDETSFTANFIRLYQNFTNNYLLEISKPRKYFDNVYETFIELQQTKEAKSKFPLLSHHYSRFAKLYDKQVDNDAYLAMSIDRVIKLQNRLLKNTAELMEKDPEDAFFLFHSAFTDFSDYLNVTYNNSEKISDLLSPLASEKVLLQATI